MRCMKLIVVFFMLYFPTLLMAADKVVIVPLNGGESEFPGQVMKTGQTTSYATGDDGDLEAGVAWPIPRFKDNNDGTILDTLTGLIWLKNANCIQINHSSFDNDDTPGDGRIIWQHALDFTSGINDGTYDCGDLSNDGSHQTDWRVPNRRELFSLIDDGFFEPSVSNTEGTGQWSEGDPFTNLQNSMYWTSSTYAGNPNSACAVWVDSGVIGNHSKIYTYLYLLPVRGGE